MEIDSDSKTEKRNHIFQRIGWLIMALFIAAAMLGYFGFGGPASRGSDINEIYSIHYDRFMRTEKSSYLFLTAHKNIDSLKIRFPEKQIRVQAVLPESILTSVLAEHELAFTLTAEESLTLKLMPRSPGNFPISIEADGKIKLLKSLTYP